MQSRRAAPTKNNQKLCALCVSVAKKHLQLHQLLLHITDRHTSLFTLSRDSREEQFAVSAIRFWIHHTSYTLVSFQNIQSELEAHEMASWQKLIRVLNHEIMNSLTPITTLASTANEMVTDIIEEHSADNEAARAEALRQEAKQNRAGCAAYIRPNEHAARGRGWKAHVVHHFRDPLQIEVKRHDVREISER